MEAVKKILSRKSALSLAAAAALGIISYGLYRIATQKKVAHADMDPSELGLLNLKNDIAKLGSVAINDQYLIPFESFIEMFKVIRHHAKLKLNSQTEVLKVHRREILARSQTMCAEYRDIVIEQTRIEETIYEEISNIVLDELGLDSQQFQRTQEVYMTQPAHQNRFFASIQQTTPGILKQNVGEQPNQDLSDKDKVKTMFIFSEQIKMQSMTDMQ